MTPVMHDSPEWNRVHERLEDLSNGQARLEGKVDTLAKTQADQHAINQEDIKEVQIAVFGNWLNPDTDNPGIKVQVDRIETSAQMIVSVLKVIAWIMGIGIAITTLYIGYLELHHRISENQTPSAYVQHAPTDASATATHY